MNAELCLQYLLAVLHDEELIRFRHRAKKKAYAQLVELLSAEIELRNTLTRTKEPTNT